MHNSICCYTCRSQSWILHFTQKRNVKFLDYLSNIYFKDRYPYALYLDCCQLKAKIMYVVQLSLRAMDWILSNYRWTQLIYHPTH